jgi:hypothetical protein
VLVRTTVEVGAVSAATLLPSFRSMHETVGVVENSFSEILFRIRQQMNVGGDRNGIETLTDNKSTTRKVPSHKETVSETCRQRCWLIMQGNTLDSKR